jgi:hypothetical protein
MNGTIIKIIFEHTCDSNSKPIPNLNFEYQFVTWNEIVVIINNFNLYHSEIYCLIINNRNNPIFLKLLMIQTNK